MDSSVWRCHPFVQKKIGGEKGIPQFPTEGLGASPNRFTQTDSSLEKEWEVAEDLEGMTSIAHPPPEWHRRRAGPQVILLKSNLLVTQLQLSPPSAQECRGITHAKVHG